MTPTDAGDPACWLDRVCGECGAYMEEIAGHACRGAPTVEGMLRGLGYSDELAAWFATEAPAGSRPGRLARAERNTGVVLAGGEPAPIRLPRGADHVAGDWVAVMDEPDGACGLVAAAVVPRRGALVRADPDGGTAPQVLAAHVDAVFIVCGLDRPLRPGRIERAVVMAWESGIVPVLVLTKADVVASEARAQAIAEASAAAPGADVVVTSSVTGAGLDQLAAWLVPNRSAALIGESGAGKSSLVNRLAGTDEAVGRVRPGDAKGRHTTTARHLVPLPGGGALLDTPGLRQIGLWSGEEGLAVAFADVEGFAAQCRFSDCAHDSEPGCAAKDAVAAGGLPAGRLDSWRQLRSELDRQGPRVVDHERRTAERKRFRSYKAVQANNPKRPPRKA